MRYLLLLSALVALPSCSAQPSSVANVADSACHFVAVFDPTDRGKLVGTFCSDVVHFIEDALKNQRPALKAAPAPCDEQVELVEVRRHGVLVGHACPAYADAVARAVQ